MNIVYIVASLNFQNIKKRCMQFVGDRVLLIYQTNIIEFFVPLTNFSHDYPLITLHIFPPLLLSKQKIFHLSKSFIYLFLPLYFPLSKHIMECIILIKVKACNVWKNTKCVIIYLNFGQQQQCQSLNFNEMISMKQLSKRNHR